MYLSIYLYPVPSEKVSDFLRVLEAASNIYREFGCSGIEILEEADLSAAYGCMGIEDSMETQFGERIFMSIHRFNDRSHRDEVMAMVDADKRINNLYTEIAGLIDMKRVVRGEFEGSAA